MSETEYLERRAGELREELEAYRWLRDRLAPLLAQLYALAYEAHVRYPRIYKNPRQPPSYGPETVSNMLLDLIERSQRLVEELASEEARITKELEAIEKHLRGGQG